MERYRDMQLFAALAGQSSLASAARQAQVSGPTLVRAIARLEARLRVVLLQRSTRGANLTDAGHAYLADCVRLLAAVDAAEASANGSHRQAQGNLRVFLPLLFSRYVMTPLLADYMERYPAVRLFAHYQDYYPNLHEEGLDVAVLVGELPSSSLIARQVGQVRTVLCASPDYLAARGEPQHPADLKQHHLIANAEAVHWDFPHYILKTRPRLSCATVQGAINAAVQGAGVIRCLSYPVHDHLMSGHLRRVLPAFELPALPVHVVYREGRHAPMRVRSFVDYCVTALREHPAFQLA
ncbi:LysR family transcriptional regulator [Pseudomonas haemolytica]|uniref:LysR family transcriptional regulator n=1 Tax=Pseudomonas haemolytica TaxID=2600065 RepID=A0A5P1DB93_9PSED|nr:LysR family transcriptional regulator [Pseudomonas haemolytica]MBJ2245113.1 LysR family transcriptional regulator [Pseudomonas haemolytica]MBJ2272449.1 LysR family transcriptional regulator [Pseudomonas haemolytica]MBK3446786.1 LysR family transcriptional regulator [Pseudomonas haemolytica]MBK3458281.1 LysR family transcriptional regulator [Pseudomonas haemolytica]MRJ36919.1 LysR family transcriptional regulator [Pseudomonas haemolytica]